MSEKSKQLAGFAESIGRASKSDAIVIISFTTTRIENDDDAKVSLAYGDVEVGFATRFEITEESRKALYAFMCSKGIESLGVKSR